MRKVGDDEAARILAGVKPDDLDLDDQLGFLAAVLPPPPARLLDVGCGRGQVSAALMTRGFDVVGLDPDYEAVQIALQAHVPAVEARFLDYDPEEPFDVVLFSRSLHHISDLDAAIDRACALLQPGGLVVADEFALEEADSATAAWFYGMLDLLESTGFSKEHGDELHAAVDEEPLSRWQRDHADDPPLHTGSSMLEGLSRRLTIEHKERTAYLFVYLCGRLKPSHRAYRVAKSVLQLERALIREGSIAPTGLRITGRSSAPPGLGS
jgi:SAM-dependent methyltransferase